MRPYNAAFTGGFVGEGLDPPVWPCTAADCPGRDKSLPYKPKVYYTIKTNKRKARRVPACLSVSYKTLIQR